MGGGARARAPRTETCAAPDETRRNHLRPIRLSRAEEAPKSKGLRPFPLSPEEIFACPYGALSRPRPAPRRANAPERHDHLRRS